MQHQFLSSVLHYEGCTHGRFHAIQSYGQLDGRMTMHCTHNTFCVVEQGNTVCGQSHRRRGNVTSEKYIQQKHKWQQQAKRVGNNTTEPVIADSTAMPYLSSYTYLRVELLPTQFLPSFERDQNRYINPSINGNLPTSTSALAKSYQFQEQKIIIVVSQAIRELSQT